MTTVMNPEQARKLVKIINDSLYKPGTKVIEVMIYNEADKAVAGNVSFDDGKFEPIFLEAALPVIEKKAEPVKVEATLEPKLQGGIVGLEKAAPKVSATQPEVFAKAVKSVEENFKPKVNEIPEDVKAPIVEKSQSVDKPVVKVTPPEIVKKVPGFSKPTEPRPTALDTRSLGGIQSRSGIGQSCPWHKPRSLPGRTRPETG